MAHRPGAGRQPAAASEMRQSPVPTSPLEPCSRCTCRFSAQTSRSPTRTSLRRQRIDDGRFKRRLASAPTYVRITVGRPAADQMMIPPERAGFCCSAVDIPEDRLGAAQSVPSPARPRLCPSMRVLMLTQFYPPVAGGQEQHVRNLAHALVERGHSVEVVTIAVAGPAGTSLDGERHRPPNPDDGPTSAPALQRPRAAACHAGRGSGVSESRRGTAGYPPVRHPACPRLEHRFSHRTRPSRRYSRGAHPA